MCMGHADDPRDDRALVTAVAEGDSGALRVLYLRHSPWLSVRLRGRCNDRDLVNDVLQDTFVAVWRGADRFREDGSVGAWLWGIGIRRLISRLRRRSPVTMPLRDLDQGKEPAAEDTVLLGVEYGDMGAALASLSPELRAVMQATVLDGLTAKEAAQLLGIPVGTVKTRAMRARVQLRDSLAEGAL